MLRKCWVFWWLGWAMCLSPEVRAGGSGEAQTQSGRLSLGRLDAAAHLLKVAMDRPDLNGTPACGISTDEARALVQPLKARWDAALEREAQSLQKLNKKSGLEARARAWSRDCSKDCSCGAYGTLLEKLGRPELAESLNKAAQAQGTATEEGVACARRAAGWFCKSALLQELRRDARAAQAPAAY